jgi:hypothetical protein
MKIYADRLPVAVRQLLTDLLVIVWVYAWIRAAMWAQDQVQKLAVPGQKLESAGGGIADNLAAAGDKVGGVPLVGDQLTGPFSRAADAARSLSDAGQQLQQAVDAAAWATVAGVLVFPLGLVLLLWLPLRLRWMRRAALAQQVRDQESGRDLLALRALATQPLGDLARIGPDVAAAWRRGDESIVDALAALELRKLGLAAARR